MAYSAFCYTIAQYCFSLIKHVTEKQYILSFFPVYQIADLSRPVMELKEALQLAQLEMDLDQEDSFPPAPDEALGREGAERLLMDCLQNRQMTNAVHLMRHLRSVGMNSRMNFPCALRFHEISSAFLCDIVWWI